MRALLAKLKGPRLFVRYIEEFAKNHVRKNESQLYVCVCVYIYIYMVFTTKGLFEVVIESWPEWDSNRRPTIFIKCIKMCKDSSAKYYQNSKERLQKSGERYQSLTKEEKEKSSNQQYGH